MLESPGLGVLGVGFRIKCIQRYLAICEDISDIRISGDCGVQGPIAQDTMTVAKP